jgi:hypothetical protein
MRRRRSLFHLSDPMTRDWPVAGLWRRASSAAATRNAG